MIMLLLFDGFNGTPIWSKFYLIFKWIIFFSSFIYLNLLFFQMTWAGIFVWLLKKVIWEQ